MICCHSLGRATVPVLALLFMVAALSCSPSGEDSSGALSSEAASPAPSGPRFLSIGTAPPGGAFFVVGGALGEVLGQAADAWEVTAEATKGSQENIRRLAQGELDLALANAAITYFAVRGEGGWDRQYDMRAVMTLAPNVALFITPEASGVSTMADLAGKRVSTLR